MIKKIGWSIDRKKMMNRNCLFKFGAIPVKNGSDIRFKLQT